MRIISGKWRGKKLLDFDGTEIRPTTDRIKETIFNMITTKKFGSRILADALVLDCFSGTGSLSIEALSRGARFAHMWDNSKKSMDLMKENLKSIPKDLYKLNKTNAYNPTPTKQPAHIIFIDPPYEKMAETADLLISLDDNNWIDSHTLLIIESSTTNKPQLTNNYTILESKTMGKTTVTFAKKIHKKGYIDLS